MSNTLIGRVALTAFLAGAVALAGSTAGAQNTSSRGIRVTKDGGRTETTSGGEVTSRTTPAPTAPTTTKAPSTTAAPTNNLSGSTPSPTSPSTTSGVTGSVTSPSSPSAVSSPTSSPTTGSTSAVDTTGLRASNSLAPSSGSAANPTAGITTRDSASAGVTTTSPSASMSMPAMNMPMPTLDVSTWTDANVVAHLAMADSMEVQMANLAQGRAASADVRELATLLARDHSQHLTQLQAVAAQTGFAPSAAPNDPGAAHAQQMMQQIASLQGAAFDSAFVASQVMHHEMDLTMLGQLRARAQSTQLQQLIDQTVPVIQTHLDRARALASR